MQENLSADSTPPFLLNNASKEHRVIKIPINKAEDVNAWLTMKAVKKLRLFLDAFRVCLSQYKAKLFIYFLSIVFCICHLLFQAYLMYKHRSNPFFISLFGGIFISILFFFTIVIIKFCFIIKRKEYSISMTELFATSSIIYCSLSLIVIMYTFTIYIEYCISITLLVFLSYNLLAIHALLSFLLTTIFIFLAILEASLRLITCKFKNLDKFHLIPYNVYFYNSSMKDVKACTTCLRIRRRI